MFSDSKNPRIEPEDKVLRAYPSNACFSSASSENKPIIQMVSSIPGLGQSSTSSSDQYFDLSKIATIEVLRYSNIFLAGKIQKLEKKNSKLERLGQLDQLREPRRIPRMSSIRPTNDSSKRTRKKKTEVVREYVCEFPDCGKAYG